MQMKQLVAYNSEKKNLYNFVARDMLLCPRCDIYVEWEMNEIDK